MKKFIAIAVLLACIGLFYSSAQAILSSQITVNNSETDWSKWWGATDWTRVDNDTVQFKANGEDIALYCTFTRGRGTGDNGTATVKYSVSASRIGTTQFIMSSEDAVTEYLEDRTFTFDATGNRVIPIPNTKTAEYVYFNFGITDNSTFSIWAFPDQKGY